MKCLQVVGYNVSAFLRFNATAGIEYGMILKRRQTNELRMQASISFLTLVAFCHFL